MDSHPDDSLDEIALVPAQPLPDEFYRNVGGHVILRDGDKFRWRYGLLQSIVSLSNDMNSLARGDDSLVTVSVHDGVVRICNGSFVLCLNLLEVAMSDSVETIPCEAFACCPQLVKVTMSKCVKSIEMG